jgi:hypothetical protein
MDFVPLAILILSACASLFLVPDIHLSDLIEPSIQAALSTPVGLTALVWLRFRDARPVYERRGLALFLLLMPTVYLSSLALHGGGAPWPMVEIAGQVLFAALAIAGVRVSGWFLAVGLGAHGVLWDLWHHGRTTFIPDWYTIGCLIVDVGCFVYAASRVSVWHADEAAHARDREVGRFGSSSDVATAAR